MISKAGLTAVKGFKYAGINAGGDSREKGYKDAKSCVSEVSSNGLPYRQVTVTAMVFALDCEIRLLYWLMEK
jgi:hypothetical protein